MLITHNLVIAEPDRARDPSAGPTQSAVLMKARRTVRDQREPAGGAGDAGAVDPARTLSPASTQAASAQAVTTTVTADGWPAVESDWPKPDAGTTLSDWPKPDAGLDEDELPRRVRQASLAPQLREGPARPPSMPDVGVLSARSPEEARVTMSAIQRGWERGRSVFDAAGPSGTASTSPSGTASTSPSGTASTGPDSAADCAHATSPAADTAAGQVSGDGAAAGTHHSDD
ncbi:MAG TPA: hypothetical protein DHU96_17600 [Actinobacteria bacterium]|nr:hypothetical protein [Actinomycetota bacterium]